MEKLEEVDLKKIFICVQAITSKQFFKQFKNKIKKNKKYNVCATSSQIEHRRKKPFQTSL